MVVWWVRRDLRLTDNPALQAALAARGPVLPVFVLDPFFDRSPYAGAKRRAFLYGGLGALDAALRGRGSRLVVRSGRPADVLASLLREVGGTAVYAQEEYSSYARRRDREVGARVPLTLVHGLTVHPPDAVVKADGTPYTVFTPFARAWKALPPPRSNGLSSPPERLATPPAPSESLPSVADRVPCFLPGEDEAQRRLKAFAQGRSAPLLSYAEKRDRVDLGGTSRLSPYLRFGMLSPRQAAAAAYSAMAKARGETRRGAEIWLNQLIWREFYGAILYHFPDVQRHAFREELRGVRWENDDDGFAAWCGGKTGYPIVDAAMRQLVHTGWMHNRARMIVGSFLVKDLLVDWRRGERFFMQHLIDGDPAANNGGWQWVAGTGTDAAPYFRIFNPVLQGKKFDPSGAYIRRWLPELATVTDEYIHEPWRMSPGAQRAAGCIVGQEYPAPIVDHQEVRERTLARYAEAKALRG